jgi:hypothetical protein
MSYSEQLDNAFKKEKYFIEQKCSFGVLMCFLSGAIPDVYVLIRIRDIRRTQLNWILLYLLYSLLRQHVSNLSSGRSQWRGHCEQLPTNLVYDTWRQSTRLH